MHYVKHFDINGVDTKQVACIELHGKPNAATEGYVGVLGIDVDSPLHDVYKCVAVNGSIYTWELLSSGMSIISAAITFDGAETAQFPYINLRTPAMYVVKIGDLIVDKEGYLYQITSLNSTYCVATYCDTQVFKGGTGTTDFNELKNKPTTEPWTFTLEDGSTVKKAVYAESLRTGPVTITMSVTVGSSGPCAGVTYNGQTYYGNTSFNANIGDVLAVDISGFTGITLTVNGVVIRETSTFDSYVYEHTVTSNILIDHGSFDNGHAVVIITDE